MGPLPRHGVQAQSCGANVALPDRVSAHVPGVGGLHPRKPLALPLECQKCKFMALRSIIHALQQHRRVAEDKGPANAAGNSVNM